MDHVDDVLAEIKGELVEQNQLLRGDARLRAGTKDYDDDRQGSRYVGPNASESLVKRVASGGTIETAPRLDTKGYGGGGLRYDTGGASLVRGIKALSSGTGSSGGYITFPTLLPQLTPLLQARTATLAMGAIVTQVEKELDVAALSSSATAYFVAENAQIPVSEETFSQTALLVPKPLAALVPVSNKLLRTARVTPALEDGLRSDLATVLALRMDLAFLTGTGTGGEPARTGQPERPHGRAGSRRGRIVARLRQLEGHGRGAPQRERLVRVGRLDLRAPRAQRAGEVEDEHRELPGRQPESVVIRCNGRRRQVVGLQLPNLDAGPGESTRRQFDRLHVDLLLQRLGRTVCRPGVGDHHRDVNGGELLRRLELDLGLPERPNASEGAHVSGRGAASAEALLGPVGGSPVMLRAGRVHCGAKVPDRRRRVPPSWPCGSPSVRDSILRSSSRRYARPARGGSNTSASGSFRRVSIRTPSVRPGRSTSLVEGRRRLTT